MADTDLVEVVKGGIERSLDGLHTSIPATVTAYNATLQQCSVQPVIEEMPELHDVPVAWPRGGGHYLHLPLAEGDSVLCVFCEADFGPWRLLGTQQAPAQLRRHGLYAYAIPGAATDLEPLLTPTLFGGAILGKDAGMQVRVDSAVELGAFPALLSAAVAELVDARWADFASKFAGPSAPVTTTALAAAISAVILSSPVASTQVKVGG